LPQAAPPVLSIFWKYETGSRMVPFIRRNALCWRGSALVRREGGLVAVCDVDSKVGLL